jgi:outer membrane lipoprotein-sorting protein
VRLTPNAGQKLVLGCSAALLAAGLLSGCATADAGLQREAARQLQARVLEVTQASSQNDPAAALQGLEGL